MWFDRVFVERGEEKLLDLDLLLVPHTKDAAASYHEIRKALQRMTTKTKPKPNDGRRR